MEILLALGVLVASAAGNIDPNGYLLYCPCMGRFGNQADQFLGTMQFAKNLNRTLVLAPWVEYQRAVYGSTQIRFDKYFRVEEIQKYHRAMLLEDFMADIAPTIWPVGKRIAFCYTARHGSDGKSCNAKSGNPFGPFWDYAGVDFDGSEFYGPLRSGSRDTEGWRKRYPPSDWPVLAFTGNPGDFPVASSNVHLQKYLVWSQGVVEKAESIIEKHLQRPFVAIHLRIGSDWVKVCENLGRDRHLFASPQCLGDRFQHGELTNEMCLPSADTAIAQLIQVVTEVKAKSVFLGRDSSDYDDRIKEALHQIGVTLYEIPGNDPHTDLAVMGQADHFICNCVSTFSSFATRERLVKGLKTDFWAFQPREAKDEL